jgi:hypothetical protein
VQGTPGGRLKALRSRSRRVTAPSVLETLDLEARPESSAAELIGMVLLDLDRLVSRVERASAPPSFAIAYMDRRLAGRLATRYDVRSVREELQRRFDNALREAPDRGSVAYEQLLARLERHVSMLEATAQLVRAK